MKIRYLFLISIICMFSISTINAEEIGNYTDNPTTINNDIQHVNEQDYILNASNNEILSVNEGTYSDLALEISSGGNIKLSKALYTYDSGDSITISRSGTIDGNGAIIDMNGSNIRAFNVQINSVTIKNITFKNANYDGSGSAIHFKDTGTVENCNFVNNLAKPTKSGGAVWMYQGTVKNCNFINNSAHNGGAICFHYWGVVDNCNFTSNNATDRGGAIYFGNNVGNVRNCNFNDNTARSYGAICFYNSGKLINCTFNNNHAKNEGGAIRLSSGTIENCNFTRNHAYSGGAIYCYGSKYNVNIINSNFKSNAAIYLGGAVYFYSNGGDLTKCNFTNNSASQGGAIMMGSGNVINCNLTNNNASSGSAIYLFYDSTDTIIKNSIFLNNKADSDSLTLTRENDEITILFKGKDNLLNSIFTNGDVNFTNVTYWGVNGIENTGYESIILNKSQYASGQNITIKVYADNKLTLMTTKVTNSNGIILLNSSYVNCNIIEVSHIEDSYYSNIVNFIVINKMNSTIFIETNNITTIQKEIINITVNAKKNKNITVYINNSKYYVNNGTLILDSLKAGNYNITVVYLGDDLYNSVSNSTTFTVVKENLTIILEKFYRNIYVGTRFTLMASLNKNVTGNVIFNINGVNYSVAINNTNIARYYFTPPNNTTLIVFVAFEGNDLYNSNKSHSQELIVNKNIPLLLVDDVEINAGEVAKINVTSYNDATGYVSVLIGSKNYTSFVIGGKSSIMIPNLNIGNYTANVIYYGDVKYYMSSTNISIIVNRFNIIAHNVTKYYGGSERFIVTVQDFAGNPIANANVNITINGNTYPRTTSTNGQTSIALNLNSGKYDVTTVYDDYEIHSTATIKETVIASDFSKMYKNDTQYYATFLDSTGKPLAEGTTVKFNINGVFYTRSTNANGVAKMNINLNPNKYILTATNPVTGENKGTTINVLSTITENYDLTKYYKNDSQYRVRLLDSKGNPVGAGVKIEFNINGVFYTRTSDENGYVKMNINLNPGTYIITGNYNGLMASNIITVKPILEAKDLNMKYKDGSKFETKLVDGTGKPYADQTITFNINGVFYSRTTDTNGIARLNINLMAGEYIITSMYSNGAAIANKVTISS